jgi:CRP/FNR family transcriptional regulator
LNRLPTSLDILKNCQVMSHLSPEWLGRLADESRVVQFDRGQVIFRHGEPCPGLYCVGAGLVRVFQLGASGKELVLHFAEPGKTFGEVAALGGFPAPASAQAVELTLCTVLPASRFRQLLETHHELCLQLLGGMALWVRQLVDLLEDIVLRDALSRVARHLLLAAPETSEAPFQLPMLKKDFAAHLNLTSETLSRTLRRLVDCGSISVSGPQQIQVLDRARLEQLARGITGGQ